MIFLQEKLRYNDAILMRVISSSGQTVVGIAEQFYSNRFSGPSGYGSDPICFTGAPNHWGNTVLVEGERAIVFVRNLGADRGLYQDPWHGHFSIVDINDIPHAIAHWDLLSGDSWEPSSLHDSAFHLTPGHREKTALPLYLLEHFINNLVKQASAGRV